MSRMTSSRGAVRGRAVLMADMGQESVAADLAVKDAPSFFFFFFFKLEKLYK